MIKAIIKTNRFTFLLLLSTAAMLFNVCSSLAMQQSKPSIKNDADPVAMILRIGVSGTQAFTQQLGAVIGKRWGDRIGETFENLPNRDRIVSEQEEAKAIGLDVQNTSHKLQNIKLTTDIIAQSIETLNKQIIDVREHEDEHEDDKYLSSLVERRKKKQELLDLLEEKLKVIMKEEL